MIRWKHGGLWGTTSLWRFTYFKGMAFGMAGHSRIILEFLICFFMWGGLILGPDLCGGLLILREGSLEWDLEWLDILEYLLNS